MKNFTKQNLNNTLFKPTRWLLVALMFLLGTSGAWGAITSDGTARLYFNMKAVSWWTAGTNGNGNFAYFFNNSTGKNAWSAHAVNYSGDTYYVTIPSGSWTRVILTRNNTSTSPTWDNKWNQTGDITLSSTSNYLSKFSEGSTSVTWGNAVKPASTASVTATPTSIKTTESSTLTSALSSNASINTFSKTTYSVSPNTGTVNGSTFTATAAGNYTVTATVTYYPNAYSSLTSTATATTTITVTKSCETVAKEQYPMSPTTFTYNGSKQVPTITPAAGAGAVTSTVYKLNNTTTVANPTDAGTYTVYVTSSDGTTYCGASSLNIGTFTINKKSVAKEQYPMSATTFTYNGNKQVPTITPASGAGTVTSTIYKLNNTTTVANPTDAGTYTVYVTSSAGTNYTAASSLNIGTFTINKKTVAKEQYSMSPTTFSYNGSKQVPTITPAAGAGAVTSTVYKLNNTTTVANPTDAGTYTVYVTSNAGTNYTAASSLNIGTFTINKKTVAKEQYSMSPTTFSYNGSKQVPTITPAAGAGAVTSTVYKLNNTTTVANPTDAGTYTVYVTSSAGSNYTAASNLNIGTFTIYEVCESINGLYWEITDSKKDIYCPGDIVVVTLTYKGSAATDYAWGGDNGGISKAGGTITSGSKYQFTLYNTGNINMTLTGCDGETATTETLYFTVATAPAKPDISPNGTINVGQNKSTTITVNNMDANATYVCYNANDQEVGTWNGNSVTFNVGDATGSFAYSIVATSKTCDDLTAETEFTVKVEEAGVKIAALGSKALYTNDPTHFIPLYVSNEDLAGAGVGATSVKKYTWQFSANGTSGWADCTRNYGNFNAKNNKSESKVVVSNGGEKSNNYRANQVGYYRCKLTYDNGEEQVSGNIQVTGTTNSKTNKQHIGITYNLPIISVNTGANSFPSDAGLAKISSDCGSSRYPSIHADDMKEKISVDVMMFNPDGSICYDRKARMNYRGSSSLNFKKKSYAFVTGKEKTKNEKGDVDTGKANLFGLSNGAEDKDWVLYAATPDPSMMRNRLTFDLYQKMRPGEWGVNSMYVELVVNGEYRGVYVLMDKITCNANRVNIKNENGFIVKFDKTDVVDRVENTDGDQKTFATSRTGTKGSSNGIESYGSCIDQRFEIEYPEKEDIELWDAFYGKVQQRFEDFETALEKKDYATVRTLIDYNSWADWFIITELAKNQDGFRASCMFVYDGDKIEARPLWDQELSFNNGTRVKHGIDSPDGLIITTSSVYGDAFYPPFWFTGNKGTSVTGGLLNDPCFVSLVKQKWATYQSGVCSPDAIGDMVAAYNTELGNAINREAARWPYTEAARGTTTDGDYIGYYSQGEGNPAQYSFAASKNAITAWISDRSTALNAADGLGKAINSLNGEALIFTITPSLAETTPWQQVQLTVNAPVGYEYTLNVDELKADNAIIKENGDSYGIKIPRPAAWGVGGNGTPVSKQYNVTATIEVSGENACGTISNNTATSVVKLNDITEACNPEIIKK